MSKEGIFLVYATERYRQAKSLTGNEVTELFKKYEVMDFIINQYEPLHITGDLNIIREIDDWIVESNGFVKQD